MIVVECYPDEVLIETLLGDISHFHENGIGNAINLLHQEKSVKIALLDKPKKALPSYLENFIYDSKNRQINRQNIEIVINTSLNKIIVFLCNCLEEFLIECCKESNIKPEDFGFSSNIKDLHSEISHKGIKEDKNFRQLLHSLKNSTRMKELKETLEKLLKGENDALGAFYMG